MIKDDERGDCDCGVLAGWKRRGPHHDVGCQMWQSEIAPPLGGIKLVKAHMTSSACPSQWNAEGDDGTKYYLRYRWGEGTMEDALNGVPVASFDTGDSMDGVISLPEFAEKAGIDVTEVQYEN